MILLLLVTTWPDVALDLIATAGSIAILWILVRNI